MTLRKKTVLISGVALLVLMAVVWSASRIIVSRSFSRVETESARDDVGRVLRALDNELGRLKATDSDWAWWDDTYHFVQDHDQAYVQANLANQALATLDVSLMVFVDRSGTVVYGKAFDLQTGKGTAVPQSLLSQVGPDSAFVRQDPATTDPVTGVVALPEGPLLFSTVPILTSDYRGPAAGTLIVGRYLDRGLVAFLARQTNLRLSVFSADDSHLPPDVSTALGELRAGSPVSVHPFDADTVAAYALMRDLHGDPAFVIRTAAPRTIYGEGQRSLRYFLLSLLLMGLAVGAVSLFVLHRSVLSRLGRLRAEVHRIGESGDLAEPVSVGGRDELAEVAEAINRTLRAIEDLRREGSQIRERHHAVVEQASEAIFIVDVPTRRILEANPAGWRLMGFDEGSGEDLDLYGLLDLDREQVDREVQGILDRRRRLTWEAMIRRRDGRLVDVELSATVVADPAGEVLCVVARDVAARREAERRLTAALDREQEAARRLRELDGMKNTFLEAVSHDLRTPLAATLGLAVTLRREDIELSTDERRDLFDRLVANAQKLDRLLADLLDVDRLARGAIEPRRRAVEMELLIGHVVEEAGIEDRPVSVDAHGVVAVVDGPKVERIVENLLVNTVRHTAPGTPVWIRAQAEDDGLLLAVEDAGPGVPDELKDAVFEPFRQGPQIRPHAPGSGVGLSLVAGFARLHGGRAWVEDRAGGGASFRVLLPHGGEASEWLEYGSGRDAGAPGRTSTGDDAPAPVRG